MKFTNRCPRIFLCQLNTYRSNVLGVSSGISSGFGSANNDVGAVYGEPNHNRVRCVARKRHPLAKDLAQLFVNVKKRNFSEKATVSGQY